MMTMAATHEQTLTSMPGKDYVEAELQDPEKTHFLPVNDNIADVAEAALITKRRQSWYSAISTKHIATVTINTACAVGLVFINKHIFTSVPIRHAQVSFAALHFAITAGALYAASSHSLATSASRYGIRGTQLFERKHLDVLTVLPLAFGMLASVVLTNASLAYSSIQFYQVARVLTTPTVAALEYLVLRKTVPLMAGLTLVPVCLGVGLVSWFDTIAAASAQAAAAGSTTPLGVLFAGLSLVAAATYTVLIRSIIRVPSVLLLAQGPISVVLMLYIIPFSDDITGWCSVGLSTWLIVLLSGLLACGLHVTQFLIIDGWGPVASTVVGHFKTCLIITIGWLTAGRSLPVGSIMGILLAVGGIIA
ncbi:integral membrane protein [Teratosphaeria destructans]|uniref:GDP-mannose transporter n=1 Tax=Teratosphaeria destructans TaxID=418781 RepID=A0A9W7SPB7_9PEZI|nr:integral membrane protein [Teratosphaeria destructans]